MKLSKILKIYGLFSTDVKAKLKTGQIKVDGDKVVGDLELNVSASLTKDDLKEAGQFIADHIGGSKNRYDAALLIGFEQLGTCNLHHELCNFMENFYVVRISKKEIFVISKIK